MAALLAALIAGVAAFYTGLFDGDEKAVEAVEEKTTDTQAVETPPQTVEAVPEVVAVPATESTPVAAPAVEAPATPAAK